ncbi:MAG TPA: DUF222 domain-containing protein [Acidimicrobiales bacterium]|jgi:hypothetical protein
MKLAVFEKALEDSRGQLSDFEPALITTGGAAGAFDVFTALTKMTMAASTLVAARAAEAGDWKTEGRRSPTSSVAQKTGWGFGESQGMLENSGRLSSLPETTEALKRGELSSPQLREIATTAVRNP